jgi:hypothetical protein
MTAKIELQKQERQNRTARTGLPKRDSAGNDCQNRTASLHGQECQPAWRGLPERDKQNGKGKRRQAEQDTQNRTGRIEHTEQGRQKRAGRTSQAE